MNRSLESLRNTYIRHKKLVIVVISSLLFFIIGIPDYFSQNAAKCAGTQNKYEDYLAKFYKEGSKPAEDSILSIGEELGLEISKFKTCLESKQTLAMVKQDRAEAIKLGVDGTPTFFINGKILVGAQPIESFSKVIENEPAFK